MIHILLLILKPIGIIILSILIILFTLILLVLFVPVRYRIQAEYGKNISAVLKVSWLFHILSGRLYYIEDSNIIIRLFGIPVYDANKNEKRRERKEEQKKEKDNRKKGKGKAHNNKKKETGEKTAIKNEISTDWQAKTESYEKSSDKEHKEKETVNYATNENEKSSKIKIFFKKIRALWFKIIKACKNIKYTLERIYDKIEDICNNINYYLDLVHSTEAKKAYALCKKQIIYLWKNIRPRKYKVYLHVGNEDPAITGQMMALYGILYPLYTNHVIVVPEFEQNILEGNLFIKGKITIFGLLRVLWIVYFDKNLRLFLSMLKKEE